MRYLLIVAAFALIIVPGVGHGVWTGRWAVSHELEDAAARLAGLPDALDGWHAKPIEVDPRQIAQADLAGIVAKRYVHKLTGKEMSVYLACGRPGPVSVHTPDICLGNSGYQVTKEPGKQVIDFDPPPQTAEFLMATFNKQEPGRNLRMNVYWSWNALGAWQTPAQPRLVFGGQAVLHKIYVIQPLSELNPTDDESCRDFMKHLLPQLQRTLFPATAPAVAKS